MIINVLHFPKIFQHLINAENVKYDEKQKIFETVPNMNQILKPHQMGGNPDVRVSVQRKTAQVKYSWSKTTV